MTSSPLPEQLIAILASLQQEASQPTPNADLLNSLSSRLDALTLQITRLDEPARKQIAPHFANLLTHLETAIKRLSEAQTDTATQLRALHHRATAFQAYGNKGK